MILSFEIDFDNFIEQLRGRPNLIEGFKQLALNFGCHSAWTIDTDQTGVQRDVRKLPTRARIIRGTAEIYAVPCHKRPISPQNEALQGPIRRAGFSHPNHMGTFPEAAGWGDLHQIQTQTFINQKFQSTFISPIQNCVAAFS